MTEPLFWTDPDGTAHERCKLLYFVNGEFLGEVQHDPGSAPDLSWRRASRAYFCPFCGEVWGRILLINSREEREWFECCEVPCEKHPTWSPHKDWVPGSLLEGLRNEGYLRFMPEAAIRREFNLHIKGDALEQRTTGAGSSGSPPSSTSPASGLLGELTGFNRSEGTPAGPDGNR